MDAEKIRLLYQVAGIGSVKKAAEQLNYTQSGLLYILNGIEDEIGCRMLRRTHAGVELSKEAVALQPYAEKLLNANAEFESMRDQMLNIRSNALTIGAYPLIANNWLPFILKEMQTQFPDIQITVKVGTQENVQWLEQEEVDLSIISKGLVQKGEWISLEQTELYAVVPAAIPFPAGKPLKLDQLRGFQVILPEYASRSQGFDRIEQWLNEVENAKALKVYSPSGDTLLSMVDHGVGITFLVNGYKRRCPAHVRMYPLDPPIYRETGIAIPEGKTVTPLMEQFIQCAQDYADELQRTSL